MLSLNFAIIIILFCGAVTLFSIDISSFARQVAITLIHDPDLPIDQKVAAANDVVFKGAAVDDALYAYMTILGDAVIVWRVHALWIQGKRRWFLSILWALLFGSVVTDVILTYCVARLGTEIIDGAFQKPAFCKSIQTVSYAMPTATTFAATIMIGITTWEYRRTIAPGLQSIGNVSRVEKVMIMLVESGLFYFLFFLYQVIGNIPVVSSGIFAREDLGFADLVFSFSTSIFVGWYPTLIIILAHSDRAVLDTVAASTWHAAAGQTSTTLGSSHGGRTIVHVSEEHALSNLVTNEELKDTKRVLSL